MRLASFLDAAANNDADVVQDMLRQGMSANTADYDGRTALMIAAFKGHKVGLVVVARRGHKVRDAVGMVANGADGDYFQHALAVGLSLWRSATMTQMLCMACLVGTLVLMPQHR